MNDNFVNALRAAGRNRVVRILPVLLLGIVLGIVGHWGLSPAHPPHETAADSHGHAAEATIMWTCSMHPEVILPNPGKCPKCGMDLIPMDSVPAEAAAGPRTFTTSPEARALMNIKTAVVERRFPTAEIRMVGKVDYDETRLAYITAWVPGRLDRLFVDYTGIGVREGEHMVQLYSPDLYAAQEELLQALRAVKNLAHSDVDIVRKTAEATVDAAREKLRLLGLTDDQVAQVEQRGTAEDRVTIYSPVSGIVIHKNAQEGMYVQTGTRIYTLADLSHVWVKLDAYESDLSWLRYGQQVEFTSVSYPGEVFNGTIAFIDPVLNPMTRTVKVRVNVPNPRGMLKPEMFVNAVVHSRVAAGGRVFEQSLAGKWICPMHPEVVKDDLGDCDICDMPLVRAESLGYVSDELTDADKPLVIPVSAALVTGTRAVVYVEVPDAEKPTYEGREVVLGPRAGAYYIVREGLSEGDRVVTRGNFKIDSALQILAKPSMMSPEGGVAPPTHHHGGEMPMAPTPTPAPPPAAVPQAFSDQLSAVFAAYFRAAGALANDDAAAARTALDEMSAALEKVDMTLLSGEAHRAWMKHQQSLAEKLTAATDAENLASLREAIYPISQQMAEAARQFPPAGGAYYEMHCPMAFDGRGATWLQDAEAVHNPYYGEAMLTCGELQDTIVAPAPEHTHE